MMLIYKSKSSGKTDISLADLCRQEDNLTFNPETGFNEIEIDDVKNYINPDYAHISTELPKLNDLTVVGISKYLILAIKEYFKECWNSKKFHLVFCSGGMDSRIMSWCLTQLREELGRKWLGKIHFVCHEPEGPIFRQVMEQQGWHEDEYSVYKEGQEGSVDYYNICSFETNVNAYHRPAIEFWHEVVPRNKEKDVVCINGACGGELFIYPLRPSRQFSDNRYDDLRVNASNLMVNFCKGYNRWGDLLMPFLSYKYLDVAFRVPEHCFKWIEVDGIQKDLLRHTMIQSFGDTTPYYHGHSYNLRISQDRADYIKEKYHNSKFYRDYQHLDEVRDAEPWSIYQVDERPKLAHIDLKIYGYATMYENI
jgi:hypothetical protein